MAELHSSAENSSLLLRVLNGAVVCVVAVRFALWLSGTVWISLTPGDAFHLESKMTYLVREVASGRVLYPDWRSYPYESNFFGPAYFLAAGTVGRLLQSDAEELVIVARVFTWLSVIALGCALFGWAIKQGNKTSGAIAVMLLCSSACFWGFGQMARPDMLAVCLGFVGFFFGAVVEGKSRHLAPLFLALGFLTKQTVLSAGVALCVWHWLRGDKRSAIGLLACWALWSLAGISLVFVSGEPRILSDLMAESSSPFEWQRGIARIHRALLLLPGHFAVACLVLGALLVRGRGGAVSVLVAVSLVWNCASSLKRGADLNYFLEFAGATAIAVITLVHGRFSVADRPDAKVRAATVVVLLLCVGYSLPFGFANAVGRYRHYALLRPGTVLRQELDLLERWSGSQRVLSDSPYLAYRSSGTPPCVDIWLFRNLVLQERINPAELIRRIEQSEFQLVVLTARVEDPSYDQYEFGFPKPVATAIRGNYRFQRVVAGHFVYVPLALSIPGQRPYPEAVQ